MLLTTIGWASDALVAAILYRAFRARLMGKYPFFFTYIGAVLVAEIALSIAYYAHTASYRNWYWTMNFATLLLGCGIVLEIFNHVLEPYRGAARFARTFGYIVFGTIFCYAVIYPSLMAPSTPAGTNIELERDLRTVQAIFLIGLLGVISYYGIKVGKNMKGMMMGYVVFIGTSLIYLALRSYVGTSFYSVWGFVQPLSFVVCLGIWTSAMWSYQPNPAANATIRLEADYEVLVANTKEMLGTLRSYFGKAAR